MAEGHPLRRLRDLITYRPALTSAFNNHTGLSIVHVMFFCRTAKGASNKSRAAKAGAMDETQKKKPRSFLQGFSVYLGYA